MSRLILHQFLFSHYNEKVRWALAYKNLTHARRTYLPGPHVPMIKKLSGQTQTPVLESAGQIISGSAEIIDWLENRFPLHQLYPTDAALRHQALQWQSAADSELGPAVRAILFAELVHEPDFLCAMFALGKPATKRFLYRRLFPLAKPMIAKGNGIINQQDVARARLEVASFLDRVGSKAATSPYLTGSSFTVADLGVASLIAPLAVVSGIDMQRPDPVPRRILEFIETWQSHPAVSWCQQIYALHRENGSPSDSD